MRFFEQGVNFRASDWFNLASAWESDGWRVGVWWEDDGDGGWIVAGGNRGAVSHRRHTRMGTDDGGRREFRELNQRG